MKFKNVFFYILFFLGFAAYNVFVIWGLVDWNNPDPFINTKITIVLVSLPILIISILIFLILCIAPIASAGRKKKKTTMGPSGGIGSLIIGKIIEKVMSSGGSGGGFGGGMPGNMDFDFDFDKETDEKDEEE